jgi:hypothetical protein
VVMGYTSAILLLKREVLSALDVSLGKNERIRGCIQKFPDWPPTARTANGTALCTRCGCIGIL